MTKFFNLQRLRRYVLFLGAIALCYILFSVTVNVFSYFDPMRFCYISINTDILRGNKGTINEAIARIRTESPSDYDTLCRYVDEIQEKYCIEKMFGQGRYDLAFDSGCYIRGSKVIQVFPSLETNEDIIQKRAELIRTYAQKSKAFWNSRE